MKDYSEILIGTWNLSDNLEEMTNMVEKSIVVAYKLFKDFKRFIYDNLEF